MHKGGKYLVIDPSNATFSHILAGASDNIRVCFDSAKKFQMYKPGGQTGPNLDQWRDCIDTAVKLAFNIEFNATHGMPQTVTVQEEAVGNNGRIAYDKLRDSVPIKEVTNNAGIYDKIPAELSASPIRLKQSSDVKVGKKVDAILKIVHKVSNDLTAKMTSLDLRHSQSDFDQKVGDFYTTIGPIVHYKTFERECMHFLHSIAPITGNEAIELLGGELVAIDHLP